MQLAFLAGLVCEHRVGRRHGLAPWAKGVLALAHVPVLASVPWGFAYYVDQFGNVYVTIQIETMPGASIVVGDIETTGNLLDFDQLSEDEQEQILIELMTEWGSGLN